jgi:hypothetical protein
MSIAFLTCAAAYANTVALGPAADGSTAQRGRSERCQLCAHGRNMQQVVCCLHCNWASCCSVKSARLTQAHATAGSKANCARQHTPTAAPTLVLLTCCCTVHVAWVLEELCCAPQWPDAGALLQLQGHLSNKVKELVGLS